MNTKSLPLLALALGMSAWTLKAQDDKQPPPPPPDGQMSGDNGGQQSPPPPPPPDNASGGDSKDGQQPPPPLDGKRPVPAIVKALDANHDGVIDADEITNAPAALKALDKNGDGKLTRDEYMGPPPPRPPQDGQQGTPDGDKPQGSPVQSGSDQSGPPKEHPPGGPGGHTRSCRRTPSSSPNASHSGARRESRRGDRCE